MRHKTKKGEGKERRPRSRMAGPDEKKVQMMTKGKCRDEEKKADNKQGTRNDQPLHQGFEQKASRVRAKQMPRKETRCHGGYLGIAPFGHDVSPTSYAGARQKHH